MEKKSKNDITKGWINGFIGVLLFSGSMPATKLAVMDMSPIFVTIARATIAGILALSVLLACKAKYPEKKDLFSLVLVALGCVIGFPLLSSLALQYITSAHSIVFLGMLPLATAVFGIVRGGERPNFIFWIFSIIGSLFVVSYAISAGVSSSPIGNVLMLLAVFVCGLGYAEGAKLSKKIGGWQVISWALVLSLPLMLPLLFIYFPNNIGAVTTSGWFGLGYISLFSMFIGFIFWYKGLAQGGITSVGQLQLLQPFFGLALAAYVLHEPVSFSMVSVTIGVILCVVGTKKFAK
ncbi:DMT family transporter [Chryseobacterium nematophagum]|uniref:DMT family transporter n=1 Tax=Chryseobacterium nematophagum TaxID=2305228 RepID=A0A3M7LDI2_9FLAO|nr:DMT family transporter [Chryseobacterium nematophagum]RMZ60135.1 DMT family transporter [Chryseobacterium nematophagum]